MPPLALVLPLAVALTSATAVGACAGETILAAPAGSFATGQISAAGQLESCSFLIRPGGAGTLGQSLTVRFYSNFSLSGEAACDDSSGDSSLRVYDGTTFLAPLIAEFRCTAWSLASTKGALLMELSIPAGQTVPGFEFEWGPSSDVRCFPGCRMLHIGARYS
jgi:hypothetical protein